MIGLLGNAALFAPLVTYVTRWFDRRRGVALSIVTSGQQVAGALWPPIFNYAVTTYDWRRTLFGYGVFVLIALLPLAWLMRHPAPAPAPASIRKDAVPNAPVLGFHANVTFALICIAVIGCCIAMAMPMGHLVAYCSDLGYNPARGAEMLSALLGAAFLGRMFWGHLGDRIGGLRTVLLGAAAQAVGMMLFLAIQDLVALYVVAAAFGLGFGGIIPSYVLAVRELFPAAQAGWRIATFFFFGLSGMALGNWLAGAIFDYATSYTPAFMLGLATNLATVALVAFLVLRDRRPTGRSGALSPATA
jgi:MFS family permease